MSWRITLVLSITKWWIISSFLTDRANILPWSCQFIYWWWLLWEFQFHVFWFVSSAVHLMLLILCSGGIVIAVLVRIHIFGSCLNSWQISNLGWFREKCRIFVPWQSFLAACMVYLLIWQAVSVECLFRFPIIILRQPFEDIIRLWKLISGIWYLRQPVQSVGVDDFIEFQF